MGLHESLLDVPERLRVWQLAGVQYLYLDPDAPATAPDAQPDAQSGAQSDEQPAAAGEVPAARASGPAAPAPVVAEAPAAAVAPAGPVEPVGPAGPAEPAEPAGPGETPARAMVAPPPIGVAADPADWPAPWPKIFRTAPAQPELVITYAALGLDMTGRADPRRGPMWRELLAKSGLSGKGRVAFWPLGLEDLADPLDLAIFLAGLRRLRPAVLAVFGQDAAARLHEQGVSLPAGRTVWLPDPQALIHGDKEAWEHVLATFGDL